MKTPLDILWSCVPSALLIAVVLIGFFALCFYLGINVLMATAAGVAMALVMAKTAANRLGSSSRSARSDERNHHREADHD